MAQPMSLSKRLLFCVPAFAATLLAAALDDSTRRLAHDIFQQLIEINTTDSVGSTTAAADAMAKRLLDAGFPQADVKVLGPNSRNGNMVARIHGSGGASLKPILIIGHLDVVEARREDWSTDPFRFIEKDGYYYGRGTQDMKVDDAALVTTFIRFHREGYRPDRDLILALTADEEGGNFNGVDWLLKNHRDLIDAAFVLNADAGGVTTDHGKPVDVDVEASEKQYADFRVSATNPGGHSSLPVPDNAIYHVTDALSRLEHYAFPVELNGITRTYFERRAPLEPAQVKADMNALLHNPPDAAAVARLSEDPRYNSIMRTTCVATRLNAGHANNALPQRASANINCRIFPGETVEGTQAALAAAIGDAGAKLSPVPPIRPLAIAPTLDPKIIKPAEELVAKYFPGVPLVPSMSTGATDGIFLEAIGIPVYGAPGGWGDPDGNGVHGLNERRGERSLFVGRDFLTDLVKKYAEAE